MKAAAFLLLVFLVAAAIIGWRLADQEIRAATRAFLRAHWWVLPVVFVVLATLVVILSTTSIKVF